MKFECQESCGGKCCTGEGFIFLTKKDIFNLKVFLNKSENEFSSIGEFDWTRFVTQKTTQRYLKKNGPDCIFLEKGKCSVYQARPTQCRTFPFWPNEEAKNCPGIGKGSVPKNIQDLYEEQMKADIELRDGI